MAFLVTCCAAGEGGKAKVTDLWTASCDYAPWAAEHRGVFGDLIQGAVNSVFPGDAQRVRGRDGYAFVGVRLRDNYLEDCADAA